MSSMRILRCVDDDYRQAVREAVAVLCAGGVIAYPTETTYGLGCDPRNAKAVRRIEKMKERGKGKQFVLVAASLHQVRSVAWLPPTSYRLQAKYWPGPLTLVLPAHTDVSLTRAIAPRGGEVAVRVSSHPFVRALTRAYGWPIISTSANRTGELEARSGRAVARMFPPSLFHLPPSSFWLPDLLIDAGALPRRKPSTVARVRQDGTIEVLRHGAVRFSHSSCAIRHSSL